MNREWFYDQDRKAIDEAARKFTEGEITSHLDLESLADIPFPWKAISSAGQSGYLTGIMPENLCGIDLDLMGQLLILMRMAEGAAGVAMIFAAHNSALSALVQAHENQKSNAWITMLAEKAAEERPPLLALAFPESVVPLDHEPGPRISETSDGLVKLEGDFISLLTPEVVDHLVILAPGDSGHSVIGFMDADKAADFTRESFLPSGLDEFPRTRLALDCSLSREEVLFNKEQADQVADNSMTSFMLYTSAIMLGAAGAASVQARQYANERFQTGRVIIQHQEVRRKLEGMDTQLEAAMSLMTRAAGMQGGCDAGLARKCYTFCGTAAEEVCLEAIQTLGGYGYMKDYGIEKRLRDVKTLQALTGSYIDDWLGY